MLHVPYVHISVHRTGRSASLSKLLGQELHNHSGKLGYCYTSATHVLCCSGRSVGPGPEEMDMMQWTRQHDSSNQVVDATIPNTSTPENA